MNAQAPPDATPEAPSADEAPAPERWSRRRIAAVLLLAGFGLLLAFVALLPTLVSTGPGMRWAASLAEGRINGTVAIEDLSVGWFGGTRIEGLVIQDEQGRPVVQIAELAADPGVFGWLGSPIDLGDAWFRINLPIVEVYDDGTTNLHRVFPQLNEPAGESDEAGLPVRGTLAGTLLVTAQYLGNPDDRADDGPVLDVNLRDARVVLEPGQPIENTLPVTLRVAATDAGSLVAQGTLDLDADVPAVQQTVLLDKLDLRVATVIAGLLDVELDVRGLASGELVADSAAGTLQGEVGVDTFSLRPVDGEGYATDRLTLSIDGGLAEGIADVRRLAVTTDEGGATLSAKVPIPGDDVDDVPAFVLERTRDLMIDVQSEFLTVTGGGASVAGLDLDFIADADAGRDRFGDLLTFAEVVPGGAVSGSLKTRAVGGAIQAALRIDEGTVVLADAEPGEREPLRLERLNALLVPTLAIVDGKPTVSEVQVELSVGDWLTLDAVAEDVDPETTSVSRLAIRSAAVTDPAVARDVLAGWVELPDVQADAGPIGLSGTLAWDGPARRVTLLDPVEAVADGAILATLTRAEATLPIEGEAAVSLTAAVPDLARTLDTLRRLGLSEAEPAASGGAAVTFDGRFDPAEAMTTLVGTGSVRLDDVSASGLNVTGGLPFEAADGLVSFTDSATLSANGGTLLALAGATLDLDTLRLSRPAGEVARDVGLNPVLVDSLGKYANFLFANPGAAAGTLDARFAGPVTLDLLNPTGDASQLELEFTVDDLLLENDVVGELAASLGEQTTREVLDRAGVLARIPGLDVRALVRDHLDVSQEVQEEISSLRGQILASRVALRDGRVDTNLTFDIVDPRRSVSNPASYAVTFAGRVDVETLAIDLGVSLPRELLEKWIDDEAKAVVDVVGEDAIARIAPGGVTVGFGGTTPNPTVDARPFLREAVPRAIEAALEHQTTGRLGREIDDAFRRLFE
jgi:hypothetical protein